MFDIARDAYAGSGFTREGPYEAACTSLDERFESKATLARHDQEGHRAGAGVTPSSLLVVVDGPESDRVLGYLGNLLAGCDEVHVHLAYVASALPARLLESGGSETPEEEERLEADLWAQQRRWMRSADKKPNAILAAAQAALVRAGVPRSHVHTCLSSPLDAREPADEVLILARERQCQTLVVGHRSHAWHSGLVRGHLAEQLVRRAEGFAVWVVD